MCQGHEDSAPKEPAHVVPTTSSGQPSQSEQKKKPKFKNKQQKQQLVKEQPAKAAPTHELVKSGSTQLANGTRYIDVTLIPLLKSIF